MAGHVDDEVRADLLAGASHNPDNMGSAVADGGTGDEAFHRHPLLTVTRGVFSAAEATTASKTGRRPVKTSKAFVEAE